MSADHLRTAVIDDVVEVLRLQSIVDGYQHRAHLRHGVVALEVRMGVRGDVIVQMDYITGELIKHLQKNIEFRQ